MGFEKLKDMKNNKCLAMDVISTQSVKRMSHVTPKGTCSWNLLYADGRVQTVESAVVSREIDRRGAVEDNNWNKMDDYRDMLETIAVGQDVMAKRYPSQSNPLVDRLVQDPAHLPAITLP
jgi:hypothetical protein